MLVDRSPYPQPGRHRPIANIRRRDQGADAHESQRRFAANASHELRTPLAAQRLLTEVAMEDPGAGQDLRRLGAQLLRTNERNENLIEGLLTLAESDRGVQGKMPVRLDDLARGVLEAYRELAEDRQVSIRKQLSERNTGPQVPAESVPALFEPFKRLGADRVRTGGSGGVGLGLAIVRSIVLAHQGTVVARPRQGGGLEIEVALPAAGQAASQAGPGGQGPY